MPPKNVAILGATSHIAKGLIYHFMQREEYTLTLYARNLPQLHTFLAWQNFRFDQIAELTEFPIQVHDVLINCVGFGNPANLSKAGMDVFTVTEAFDNLCLNYLQQHRETLYLNFSSGAVYGKQFTEPAGENTLFWIDPNAITFEDYYAIAKLNAEAKHRALSDLNIVDLRVFSYFSRFIDLDSGYFLTEIISCLRKGQIFYTNNENMIRDYVNPLDLFRLVCLMINQQKINDAIDVYSLAPISKFELLNYFVRQYDLQLEYRQTLNDTSPTGSKLNYFSTRKSAQDYGYQPEYTSIGTLEKEMTFIV